MTIAITRGVSASINQCELTHLHREPIDLERARAQHRQYEDALRSLGVEVVALPLAEDLPDSVFVEDTALVLDTCAVMTRPGAASRRPELPSVEKALAPHREILRIEAPATLDGGDILAAGRSVFVGLTSRSSQEGIEQLARLITPRGYEVIPVPVRGCLHLKSAVTQAAAGTLLLNPQWVDPKDLPGFRHLEVDPDEPGAANAVLVDGTIIFPRAFPGTAARLEGEGIPMVRVEADELAKAEGAVTCCSLLIRD